MTNPPTMSNPGVRFPPPALYVVAAGIAWLLETRLVRIRLVGGSASTFPLEIFGAMLLLAGFGLVAWGLYIFASARTGIIPMRPATRMVDWGPYAFSRNPMYTGMSVMYLGGALVLNWGWAILLLPVAMIANYLLVIKREERYLMSAFPDEYGSYKKRVRRWL
jgi:protein-S-isoprenylcysteine O-methyltransferase Ste14